MPRALSLKKALQAAPPKNQKSITQFFSQKPQKLPIKSSYSQSESHEKKSAKRKELSLVHTEINDIIDEPCSSNSTNYLSTDTNGGNTPKKFKRNHSGSEKSPFKINIRKIDKTTPQNENGIKTKLSPRKNSPNKVNIKRDCAKASETDDNAENVNSRSPLTPISNDNVLEINKINGLSNGNHVEVINKRVVTPRKVLQFDDEVPNSIIEIKKSLTPKKCSGKDFTVPSISKLKTPEKHHLRQDELSPSKSGSTVKSLDVTQIHSPSLSQQFGDDWELDDVDESSEDLDLSTIQRYEVTSVVKHTTRLELKLKNSNNNRGTCFVEGIWLDTPITIGETISILATRDSSNQFCVNNTSGLITIRPDHLVSSTSVVSGVFCKRKAILQERWKGLDSANTAMTMGILIHELVQKALTQNILEITQLRKEADNIIKESIQMLYDAGLSEDETRSNMHAYILPLADFMQFYVAKPPVGKPSKRDQWTGHIDKVLDIEENLCCPQLGLKGKIDATLQVTIHERKGRHRATVPLELKSGKASVSAEHRGQLILYGMMLSLQRGEDPTTAMQRGLLLYLKDRVDLREVSCGYPERRDLVMLRNQLVQYLAVGPEDVDPEQLTDIEDATCLLQQKLPEPINHENACSKCPYLTICSLHLWHTDGPCVSESHPLSKLQTLALGHLSPEHIKYFLKWTALLKMEERGQMIASPLHALWTDSVEKRSKRGTCAANLRLKTVEQSGDRYLHIFERTIKEIELLQDNNSRSKGPQEGEFSIVSLDNRPWIAAGVVTEAKEKEMAIILERDLTRRSNRDTLFHIDTYESYATTVQNLTNLGVLLEDSDRATRLRKLIIDKTPPTFEKKLPREVGRLGTKLMRSLNIQQQRAVLKAISASDYALLQGLPGTGKTQTISVLIQMLVGLKLKVLVTAHTHSAVDTVLTRLPDSLPVMRLGSSSRVSSSLLHRCEQQLTTTCKTPKQLEELYDSMDVVGVTCLGASHALLTRTTFDICIVDEATQVLQCTVLRPLFAARRFVLVGDPDQLPPVVRSRAARRLGMEESLFHRLMHSEATYTLQLQYRMNQALADMANKVAYNDKLKCADENIAQARLDINLKKLSVTEDWILKACSPEPEFAALFHDMPCMEPINDSNKNCTNVDEACIVMAIVDALIQGGVNPAQIGIIAPYRDQVSLLRKSFSSRGVECSTVDQFQGRDKSVIIYSCTKREENDNKRITEGEILNDQRRLAVSVTRAKHKLIVIGNTRVLHRYIPFQKLIEACTSVPLGKEVVRNVVSEYRKAFV